jgi:tetratricopeptide (TPR) repeat protein
LVVKIGRNDPCPCGSGKKYKKCCLGLAEAKRVEEERGSQEGKRHPELGEVRNALATALRSAWPEVGEGELVPDAREDRLEQLTNGVLKLIKEKRFDEALASCEELLREYPEVIDGLDRSAMVHEARGDYALAADFYRRALAFTQQPDQEEGFDEDGRDYLRGKIAETEARATQAREGRPLHE